MGNGAEMICGQIGARIGGPLGWLIGSVVGAGAGQVVSNLASGRLWDEGLLASMFFSGAPEGIGAVIGHGLGSKLRGLDHNLDEAVEDAFVKTERGMSHLDEATAERLSNLGRFTGGDKFSGQSNNVRQHFPARGTALMERLVLAEMSKGTSFSRMAAKEIREGRMQMYLVDHKSFIQAAIAAGVEDPAKTAAFHPPASTAMVIDIGRVKGNIGEIAASAVHEVAHITDPRSLTTRLERERRAWLAEAEFAIARNISNNEAANAWQEGGMAELEAVIKRNYSDWEKTFFDANRYTEEARIPSKGNGPPIALGLGSIRGNDLLYFEFFYHIARVLPYTEAQHAGLTRFNPYNEWPLAFEEVMNNTSRVHFNLTGIDIDRALREGSQGFRRNAGMTNVELYKILTNPEWFAKTTFYLGPIKFE